MVQVQAISSQDSSCCSYIKNWVEENPTLAKITTLATATIGLLSLIAIPLLPMLPMHSVISLAVTGLAFSIISIASVLLQTKKKEVQLSSEQQHYIDTHKKECLWTQLETEKMHLINTQQQVEIGESPFMDLRRVIGHFKLPCIRSSKISEPIAGEKYVLHANLVSPENAKQKIVAAQYPKCFYNDIQNDKQIDLAFWKAICNGSYDIIDLTDSEEQINGKQLPFYYPKNIGEKLSVSIEGQKGEITFTRKEGIWNVYSVTLPGQEKPYEVRRFNYTNWEDHKATTQEGLQEIVQVMQSSNKNLWVHCKAGVERTAAAILAYTVDNLITLGEITLNNLGHELLLLINNFRMKRSSCFLQNKEQFLMVYDFALHRLRGQ